MTTEQLLLTKWQSLDSKKQEQVLAFIDELNQDHQEEDNHIKNYQPKTEIGKKLWAIRQEMIKKSDVQLLSWDDIEAEMNEIRGSK